ncbi:hypothetical protein K503DRAFT_805197, partial [Rhizopogon vinicolor AM-OR11-026]
EYNADKTVNEVGDDSAGESGDQLEPRETRSSAKRRASGKGVTVIYEPPCDKCSRTLRKQVCQGWAGEKCFPCRKGHKVCSLTSKPPAQPPNQRSVSLTLDPPPKASASKCSTSSRRKGKGVIKSTAVGSSSARRERQLKSSEEGLKSMASSLFNQAEELRLLREEEFGGS